MTSVHKTNNHSTLRAFTLLEMITVMLIISVLFGGSVFLFSRSDESGITLLPRKIEQLAKSTLTQAKHESQTQFISFSYDEVKTASSQVAIPKDVSLAIRKDDETTWRPLSKNSEPILWAFSVSGLCENITLSLKNDHSEIEVSFHPLTGAIVNEP